MLEPSYVIYPYTRQGLFGGIIVSSSTDEEKVNMPASIGRHTFGLKDLYSHKSYGTPQGLAVKPETTGVDLFVDGAADVFTIRSTKHAHVLLPLEFVPGYPPGPCDGLLNSATLDKFLKPTFFLDKVEIAGKGKTDALLVIQLNPGGTHNPLCNSALTDAPRPLEHNDRHKHSENAKMSDDRVQIDIKGIPYTLRVPADNQVRENWLKGEFTRDEAEFLNTTRLRPGVLYAVFGEGWLKDLTNFLTTLVVSECMSDISLLTNRECYNCRQFLEKVSAYFVNNSLQLDIMKEEDEKREDAEFREYVDDLYGDEKEVKMPPHMGVDSIDARDANDTEKKGHKQILGDISSYKHEGNAAHPHNERRAIIIGVNKKTGMYNFYVISTLSTLNDADKEKEDAELIKKVKTELPMKYKDHIFIY